MKRIRKFVVAIVCLISGLLIVTLCGNRDFTTEDTTALTYRQGEKQLYNTRAETQKGKKQRDGLPESAQIPDDEDLAKLNDTTLLKIYWKYINMLQILCKDVIRVWSFFDGGKEICIDPGYKPQAPCLVYSFGMVYKTVRLSAHIWFNRWGLGGKNEINSKQWNMKTLDTIRGKLGHTNRTLGLLMINIGDEWNALPQMISSGALDNVRQISIETYFSAEHADRGDFWGNVTPLKQLSALRQLYDFGYRNFMRDRILWSSAQWRGIKGFITNVNAISMIKPK